MWWIRASIQDYILRSWSLVKIGTTASQKRLFFKLRSAKSKIAALQSGDMPPDQVALIAKNFGVADQEVIDMDRRLGGDYSLNAPINDEGQAGERQDFLVDQSPSPEALVAGQDETDHRHKALSHAIGVLNDRERQIFEARQLADEPRTLEDLATEFNVSSERVRQIEMRAFEKVRHAVKQHVAKTPTPVAAPRSSRLVGSRRGAGLSQYEPVMS
jgi:RNA polymerase sigma-32 factor